VDEIAAGITHSRELLREYRCKYTVKSTWPYKPVYDPSAPAGEYRIVRFGALSEDELASQKFLRDYTYSAKGNMFSFDVHVQRDMPPYIHEEYSTREAFDGKRLLGMTLEDGEPYASIAYPKDLRSALRNALSPADLRPEDFFADFSHYPVTHWLKMEPVVVREEVETVLGNQCYVVECTRIRDLKVIFWICPEKGFVPLKMAIPYQDRGSDVYEVKEIAEVSPGIWFPLRAVRDAYRPDPSQKGTILKTQTEEFVVDRESLEVNKGDVRDDEFTFDFPVGTFVHDEFTGKEYRVGEAAPGGAVDRMLDRWEDAGDGGDAESVASSGEGVAQAAAGADAVTQNGPASNDKDGRKLALYASLALGAIAILVATVIFRRKGRA
jgi:hypothetical protein